LSAVRQATSPDRARTNRRTNEVGTNPRSYETKVVPLAEVGVDVGVDLKLVVTFRLAGLT
jgi:hypothetical protein